MSAFEADRFNRSRTSPEGSGLWPVISGQRTQRLATVSKERLQQLRATACQDAAADFYFMVQLRVIQHLHYRMHCARFGIIGAVDQALDPSVHHGSGAHWARFNCSKQVTVFEAMVTDVCTRFTQGDDLCMRGGIGVADVAVPSAANDFSGAHYHCTHGDFAGFKGALCGAQGFLHPQFVGTGG